MTKEQERLVQKLRDICGSPWIVEVATVKAVDEAKLTCDVVLLKDDTEINEVRLKAAIDELGLLPEREDGIVQVPAVDSTVLIARINNDVADRFVVGFSAVEKVVMYGGLNGGLINIQTLIQNLNKTNDMVNKLATILKSWTPVPNDGGAALKAFANSQLVGYVTGDFSAMEDLKVLH